MPPVGQGLLPIGMFSRASSLSVKTLRAYHEAGILVPARVDPRTGYRNYTADQLADAAVVQRLRALDLPLEQVRRVLVARDPELTRRILADHQIAMRERLAETERIVAELQSGTAPVTHTPVHIRYEPAMDTLRIAGEYGGPDFAGWLGFRFERLARVLGAAGVERWNVPGALFEAEIADEIGEHVEAFLPVAAPVALPEAAAEVTLGELPASHVAVLVHAGDYADMPATYRTLGAWVARNAEPSGERIREWYVVGPADTEDPARYRTEIAWPIRSGSVGAT